MLILIYTGCISSRYKKFGKNIVPNTFIINSRRIIHDIFVMAVVLCHIRINKWMRSYKNILMNERKNTSIYVNFIKNAYSIWWLCCFINSKPHSIRNIPFFWCPFRCIPYVIVFCRSIVADGFQTGTEINYVTVFIMNNYSWNSIT